MKNKKQKQTEAEVQKSSGGIFLKLFLIVMPLFILAIILVFALHIAGFNTLDWLNERGQSIPVVGEMLTDESDEAGEEVSSASDLQVLQGQVDSRNEIIDNKDEQIQEMEETIADLENQVSGLEEDADEMADNQASDGENQNQQEAEQGQSEAGAAPEKSSMTSTIESMDSEEAAAILENMENESAITILEELSTGDRGEILQEMNVEAATTYSQMLMD